jgi:hypothetical protein
MRFAFALCGACAVSAAAPQTIRNRTSLSCDPGAWHAAVAGDWHARLPGQPRPVAVVAREGHDLTVADEVSGAILVRRIPTWAFDRVILEEVPLRRGFKQGASAWAAPGVTAYKTKDERLFVARMAPIQAAGWVGANAVDVAWHDAPALEPTAIRQLTYDAEVREAPDKDAKLIARIRRASPLEFRWLGEQAGWHYLRARDGQIGIVGWVHVGSLPFDVPGPPDPIAPVPARRSQRSPDLCIRVDRDDAADALGILTAPWTGRVDASGWARVELDAAWGHITGYVHGRTGSR